MLLTYRGVAYEVPANTLPTATTKVIGKYRGAEVVMSLVTDIPQQPLTRALTYRGICYEGVSTATPVSLTPALA